MKKITVILFIVMFILSSCNFTKEIDQATKEPIIVEKEVVLYFGDSQALQVIPERRVILVNDGLTKEEYIMLIFKELLKGPVDSDLYPVLPPDTRLLNVEIEDDLLYLDFSREMHLSHWGGAAGEDMTLLSLVNTFTEVDGINRIMPSVEGAALNIEHIIVDKPLARE